MCFCVAFHLLLCLDPTTPPRNIHASANGSTEATVSWFSPKLGERNGIITHYSIDKDFNVSGAVLTVSGTLYTFSALEEFVQYSVKIAAATSAGLGPYSEEVNFTTFEARKSLTIILLASKITNFFLSGPSSAPQSVHGVFHSSTAIRFSWSSPPPLDINGVIKYYVVEVTERRTGKSWTFFAVKLVTYISSLHPYYLYDCVVAAHTIGTGPFSKTVTIQTDEQGR